jgi:transcription initiation factor IIF auxiliary subunit
MEYCRNLKFDSKPDYKYLRSLFDQTFTDLGYEVDNRWDWHIYKERTLEEKRKKEEQEEAERQAKKKKNGQSAPNKR